MTGMLAGVRLLPNIRKKIRLAQSFGCSSHDTALACLSHIERALVLANVQSYAEGRESTDPTENWCKDELGLFDFYIISLAKKLANRGVFGVSSDEYLNYAIRNRGECDREWERK
jgi:hypothetical protein